jgi:hypothetical protein
MNTSTSTNEQLNKLIEFRQAVYEQGFTQRRDAQFELLDALLLAGPISSFAELSQRPVFRRNWPSLYAAVEDGEQDSRWMEPYLVSQLPRTGTLVLPLDGSAWPRPQSPTLPDRQYVYSPTAAGSRPVVGQAYSLLTWVAEPHSSWVLPLTVERIASGRGAVQVGIQQIQAVCQQLQAQANPAEVVIAADGKYGNHHFLGPLRESACQVVVRLRKDRVLYRAPAPYAGQGRPAIHGTRFAFKAPETWGPPAQQTQFEHPRWGQVELCLWSDLHALADAHTPFAVIRARVHLERPKPPDPLWLAWQGAKLPVSTIWGYYDQRASIEASIKGRKQQLHWTQPQFRTPAAIDRWTRLVSLAQWELFLARSLVLDKPLPWQPRQPRLTPGRVQLGLGALFTQIGSPAQAPQSRGKSPGWPQGRTRTPPPRYPVVKKGKKPPGKRRKAA